MIEKLFISKVRVKMLQQFLLNNGEEFHVRGLVRILKEEINAVRRELQNLESAGILISQKKGNKLFYRVNEQCSVITELTHILYKERDDIKHITSELQKVEGISTAVLTENYLTTEYESDQDIDLLLIGDVNITSLQVNLKKIEKEIARSLRVTLMKPKDLDFQLKKRDRFLLNILKKDKILLIGSEKDIA